MRRKISLLFLLHAIFAFGCREISFADTGYAPALKINKLYDIDDWGEASPLEFSVEGKFFALSIEPAAGNFDGWVTIGIHPGRITGLACNPPACTESCDTWRAISSNLRIENARVDVCVGIAMAFGKTSIVARDAGFVPAPPGEAACSDGIDNDGDSKIDYGHDEGCFWANDGTEEGGSYIVGVSPEITFMDPRIEQVQGYSSYSPFEGEGVTISSGKLVVTRISQEGFYVTDVEPLRPDEGYNHIYAYNYNTPQDLRECDILTLLDGNVGEFYGFTELGFPVWRVKDPGAEARYRKPVSPEDCPIPDPEDITAGIISSAIAMESLESGLVQAQNGVVSSSFPDCDYNNDGQVAWEGEEKECKDNCDGDPGCTERTQYFQYGQWALDVGGSKIFVVSRDTYPEFDPMRESGRTLLLVRGTLKQIEFIEPPWIVEIRCREDLLEQGEEIVPIFQACVPLQPRGSPLDVN